MGPNQPEFDGPERVRGSPCLQELSGKLPPFRKIPSQPLELGG